MKLKIQNIADIGTAELINGLVIIPYYAKIAVLLCQQTNHLKLHRIGILVLVHHDITEAALVVMQNIRIGAEQFYRFADEVIKRKGAVDEMESPQVSMLYSKTAVVNSLMDKIAEKCRIQKETIEDNTRVKADSLLNRLSLIRNWR